MPPFASTNIFEGNIPAANIGLKRYWQSERFIRTISATMEKRKQPSRNCFTVIRTVTMQRRPGQSWRLRLHHLQVRPHRSIHQNQLPAAWFPTKTDARLLSNRPLSSRRREKIAPTKLCGLLLCNTGPRQTTLVSQSTLSRTLNLNPSESIIPTVSFSISRTRGL